MNTYAIMIGTVLHGKTEFKCFLGSSSSTTVTAQYATFEEALREAEQMLKPCTVVELRPVAAVRPYTIVDPLL